MAVSPVTALARVRRDRNLEQTLVELNAKLRDRVRLFFASITRNSKRCGTAIGVGLFLSIELAVDAPSLGRSGPH